MAKPLSLLAECEGCKEKFNVSLEDGNVVSKKKFVVEGRSIYITYYDCPKCSKRHFVQIDDNKSLEMLEVNKGQFIHNAALRAHGEKLRKKKIDQYKDTHKHLANYRKKLMEEHNGKTVYDENGESIELRFSV